MVGLIFFENGIIMDKIECVGICKSIGNKILLEDISLSVNSGECLGILGDNGSGKSTLMSIIAGTRSCNSGEILYNENTITKNIRKKIGYVPQVPVLLENLTVLDNLTLWKNIFEVEDFSNIPNFLKLEEVYRKKISSLSGGMKKKVSIGIALMNNPNFIVMDEAFAALDHKTVEEMLNYLKKSNIGILYSSHSVYEISELCDRILVLKNGKVLHYSTQKEKLDEDYIKEIYKNL